MNATPLISVLLPVYNAEKYIKDSVNSILKQDYINFELIILNDGSTDNSLAIINSVSDSRISVFSHANIGLAATLNKGIELAKGKYIARQDNDDISLPQRLSKQVEFLEKHPEVALVGTWCEIINENGNPNGKFHKHPINNIALKFFLLFDNPFVHSSVMFRKDAIVSVGSYNTDTSFFEDYNLWSRVARLYKIANIPEILLKYREVASGMSQTTNDYKTRVKNQSRQNISFYCNWPDEKSEHFINLSQGVIDKLTINTERDFYFKALSSMSKKFCLKENIKEEEIKDLVEIQKLKFKRNYYNFIIYSSNISLLQKIKTKLQRKLLFMRHKNNLG